MCFDEIDLSIYYWTRCAFSPKIDSLTFLGASCILDMTTLMLLPEANTLHE